MSSSHGLAAIAEAGALTAATLRRRRAIDDETSRVLAFNVLGDDQQRLPDGRPLEQRQDFLQARELFIVIRM